MDKTRDAFVGLMGWDEFADGIATAYETVASWFDNLFSDDEDEDDGDDDDDDSSSVDDDSSGDDGSSNNGEGGNCPLCEW